MSTDLPVGWPSGYTRRVVAEVDSTLNEALRQFDGAPLWLMAEHQTAARGRRGRSWINPPGNFAATLVLPVAEPPEKLALRSFVAALALFDAFVEVTRRPDAFTLKWPNDVLLNGGKVAGILLETLPGKRAAGVMIGIGVNLAEAPLPGAVEEGALRPVALVDLGVRVLPTEFLDALAIAYAAHEDSFRSSGFAPIREAWLARATRLGAEITARFGTSSVTGRFDTVDEFGRLVLMEGAQRHAIAAADIYF